MTLKVPNPNSYTANDWITGNNMRGETFHLWLKQLSINHGIKLSTVGILYVEAKKTYMFENNIKKEKDFHNEDEIKVSNQLESFLSSSNKHKAALSRQKKLKRIRSKFINIIAFLSLIGILWVMYLYLALLGVLK